MGRLFEGVTFDFQAAKEEAAKAAAKEAAEKATKETTEKITKEAEKELEITRHIAKMLMNRHSDDEVRKSIIKEFGLSEKQAEEECRKMVEYLFAK